MSRLSLAHILKLHLTVGTPKPLYFSSLASARYAAFLPKIIHLTADLSDADNGFEKEHLARNILLSTGLALANVSEDDLVILSDVDELPRPSVVAQLAQCSGWERAFRPDERVCLMTKMFRWSYQAGVGYWRHPNVGIWREGKGLNGNLRWFSHDRADEACIVNAGQS